MRPARISMIGSMARTTITIDDQLLRDAKVRAAQEGTTLSEIVARGLRSALGPAIEPTAHRQRIFPRVWDGGDMFVGAAEFGSIGKILGLLDHLEIEAAAREGREPRFK